MIGLSDTVKNAMLDALEVAIGASAILKIRTGAMPATTDDTDAGTVVATVPLPADWLLAAADGVKEKSGTWEDTSADAAGVAAHWRAYAADGTTCHLQGTVTLTGDGGDMEVDNTSFQPTQNFEITAFSLAL